MPALIKTFYWTEVLLLKLLVSVFHKQLANNYRLEPNHSQKTKLSKHKDNSALGHF